MRTAPFCIITQRVVLISYWRFGDNLWVLENGTDNLSQNVGKIATLRCVLSQNSAVLKSGVGVNTLRTGLLNCLNARSRGLTFRHRASCILGQAFRYSPENAFYVFNQQIYFII